MNGAITEKKIKTAAEERRENEKNNDPVTLKILEGLGSGKYCKEIAEEINNTLGVKISPSRVSQRKKELVNERKYKTRRHR